MLHATTPRRIGAAFAGDALVPIERAGFYDWRSEEADIRAARAGVVDGLVFDVEHTALWPASWGARPDGESERRDRVAALVAAAPALLPIFGHRFVLAEGSTAVLSVHQSDIIVYGSDLRAYLLAELGDLLGLPREGHGGAVDLSRVPFWGELVG